MSEKETVECAMCGKDGYPPETCEQCHGRAAVQPKNFTLSELSAMSQEERREILYKDRPSGSAPKIVNMPGSA